MLMKNLHIGLLPRIIIAIILGILGNFLPASLVRLFVTFNAIYQLLHPPHHCGPVTIAIADIGKGAGRMLVVTVAYGATLFSGFLSYFTGMAVFPS